MPILLVTTFVVALQVPNAPTAQPPTAPQDCSNPLHRQFDFWIGTWNVATNPKAEKSALQFRGTNVITKDYDGCVITERWEGAGITGSSYNIYDRTRGEWHQTWVDSTGDLHHYRGGLKDGKMVLFGDGPLPSGARFAGRRTIRLTYTPMGPDGMRQLAEFYLADGTWMVYYDLVYTRSKAQ